ncbi:MAG: DUF47 family protein [Candidatus Omnitrophota bacterium]
MGFNFLPQEFNFYDLFEKQAAVAVEAAANFRQLVTNPAALDDKSLEKMHDLEHRGDEIAHEILDRLDKTFITPFDREDIHSLAKELDDIIDMLYTIANRMKTYKIAGADKNLIEFSCVIEESARAVVCAVRGLRDSKNLKAVRESCVEINRLENVGDTMRDNMLADLFETSKDPIDVIKRKEIYQDAETVLDICEDVAHVVQSILVKQA